MTITRCACGCGRPVGPKKATGPAPLYASSACRVRACRARQSTAELTPLPEDVAAEPAPLSTGSTDDQVARAVLEARAVGFALTRLGAIARPEFGWRCTKLGESILKALVDTFGEATR